jgi:DinB family protein
MDRVKRDELLATVHADRDRFDRILQSVPPALLTEPILPGAWSVKDVLAHIAWGEREGIGVVRAHALVGSDLWSLSEDERNEAVVSESRSRGLDEVMAEYRAAFQAYISAIEGLSDGELNEPDCFEGLSERIPGWRPWRVLYDPGHYEEHGRTIAAALSESSG